MTRARRLAIALVINLGIVVTQAVAGVAAHSVGLLADAGHNLADVAAILVSLVAVRLVARPASSRRPFGWHRSTILAAQANAAGLLLVTGLIAIESVVRLLHPETVHGDVVVVVASVGLVANLVSAWVLHEGTHDLNVHSVMLHLVGDAAVSAGVVVAGAAIVVDPDLSWLDPVSALVISGVIGWQAIRLLGQTADVLLESTPAGLDLTELGDSMAGVAGVETVHDLHVWALSSEAFALSAHLVLDGHPTLEEAQVVGDAVKRRIGEEYSIVHATLELECEPCAPLHGEASGS